MHFEDMTVQDKVLERNSIHAIISGLVNSWEARDYEWHTDLHTQLINMAIMKYWNDATELMWFMVRIDEEAGRYMPRDRVRNMVVVSTLDNIEKRVKHLGMVSE